MASSFITRVDGENGTYKVIFDTDNKEHYRMVEDTCRAAIGHQKPKFPTWGEWLQTIYKSQNYAGIFITPIPADIAQKLGIEPKEG